MQQRNAQNNNSTTKVMTDIGLFVTSKVEIPNGGTIVLNSFLKDGKPKFKVTMKNMKKNEDISFSSSDSNQYLYLTREQFTNLVKDGRVIKDASGQFLQIQVEAQVAPTVLGTEAVSLEDLGLAS